MPSRIDDIEDGNGDDGDRDGLDADPAGRRDDDDDDNDADARRRNPLLPPRGRMRRPRHW